MFFACKKGIFCLLFIIPFVHCMENEDTPVAKRRRLESPKYPAIPSVTYIPGFIAKYIAERNLFTVHSSCEAENRLKVLVGFANGSINIKIVSFDRKTVYSYERMKERLSPVHACSQIESAILSIYYCLCKKRDIAFSCYVDTRSERFSRFLEFLLQQEGVCNFSVLLQERDRIQRLPFEQMRVLALWAIRRSMPAGSELLQTVYDWIRSSKTIGHIAYPQAWFHVKLLNV